MKIESVDCIVTDVDNNGVVEQIQQRKTGAVFGAKECFQHVFGTTGALSFGQILTTQGGFIHDRLGLRCSKGLPQHCNARRPCLH